MPYKLVYFPVRGRAQCIRYMCIDNDIPFEDSLVEIENFPNVKNTFMFGQLPVLYDGEFEISQTNAILHYLAKKHGLYGDSDKDMARVDMIHEQRTDVFLEYGRLVWMNFEEGKEEFITKLPEKLKVFETQLVGNNGGSVFFCWKQGDICGLLRVRLSRRFDEVGQRLSRQFSSPQSFPRPHCVT